MANYYVATNGSDTTGDGTENNPWATPGYAISQLSVLSGGHFIWIKSGLYTITTNTYNVSGGPIRLGNQPAYLIIAGYENVIGDQGKKPIINAGSVEGFSFISYNGTSVNHSVINIEFNGNSNGGVSGFTSTAGQIRFYNCNAINCSTGFQSMVNSCYAENCSTGFIVSGAAFGCEANLCTTGFSGSTGYLSMCISRNGAGVGFSLSYGFVINCTAHGNSSHGFNFASNRLTVANLLSTNNGGYGFTADNGSEAHLISCRAYNNTLGDFGTYPNMKIDCSVLSGDPYIDSLIANLCPSILKDSGLELLSNGTINPSQVSQSKLIGAVFPQESLPSKLHPLYATGRK
jgi:hypothetical protein